jgi:hypothetical protein
VVSRVMFGAQRNHPKTWDGEMTLDRGSFTRLIGVYFEHDDLPGYVVPDFVQIGLRLICASTSRTVNCIRANGRDWAGNWI